MTQPAVLISSSGRRVELWNLFHDALVEVGLDWRVIGADASGSAPTALVFGAVHRVPRATEPGFADAVREVIVREDVRLVIPTIDTELPLYAAGDWPAAVNISSREAVEIAGDKLRTAQWLASHGLPSPETYPLVEAPAARHVSWIVKPRRGSSSIGLQSGVSPEGLRLLAAAPGSEALLAQECVVGPEFTVNCYVSRTGRCEVAVPHRRLRTRGGEVSHGVTVKSAEIESLARRTVEALPGAFGAMCVQIMQSAERGPVVIEVNARFGGGYPLAHRAGARFPQRLLRDAAGIAHPQESWEGGWEMVRYDQSAFRRAQPD